MTQEELGSINQRLWLLGSDSDPFSVSYDRLPSKEAIQTWMEQNGMNTAWLSIYTDNVQTEPIYEFQLQNGVLTTLDTFALKERDQSIGLAPV